MRTMLLSLCLVLTLHSHASTVYLTRHYEKTDQPKPSLTTNGKKRAKALAEYLSDKSLQTIYSTDYKRTLETSRPLSEQTGIKISLYPANDLSALAEKLRNNSNNVLVVGHSNTTPRLIELMGGPSVIIEESDYGTLYELTIEEAGTTMKETLISF